MMRFFVLATAAGLGAGTTASAQQQPAQQPPPPPAAVVVRDTTPLLRPPSALPPSVAARPQAIPAPAVRAATPGAVVPLARVSAPPDSVRPAPPKREGAPPATATMRCKDGTWLAGTPTAAACSARGGLAVILPAPPTGAGRGGGR